MGRLILKNKTVLFGVSVFTAILMSSIALAPLVIAGGTLPDKLTECTCRDFVRLSVDDLVCFDFDLGLNTEEVAATCELLCQNNGGHRFLIQFNPDDPACIDPQFETEKFYTETDKDIEDGFFGTVLPFKNGVVDTENPTQVVKAVVDKNGNIKSYNPGQYYAVTKVTALQDLDEVWIEEDDFECTEDLSISKMSPAKVPGGAYVALMCDGVSVDLSSELAHSDPPKLFINDDGNVEAHVEDVPEGCMVFLGVKYSPGLKGENVEDVAQPWCENWEFVTAINAAGEEFKDSAHRVLEVIGLPEPEPECDVSPNPLEITFVDFDPQTHTTSIGCINDQPNGLGASPITTSCGDVEVQIFLPVPTASFLTLDAYGVDFEFDVLPDKALGPLVECSITWETDSVINGVESHEQILLITFDFPG